MVGIFDRAYGGDVFADYAASLTFRDRTAGGTPSDPRMIEAWLRSKAGITNDEERRQVVIRTLREMKPELFQNDENGNPGIDADNATYDDLVAASTKAAADRQSNGFKRPDGLHLALETRHIKALTKEVINILWAAERWGATRKGPKSFAAERVFIDPRVPTSADIERYVSIAAPRAERAEGTEGVVKVAQMAQHMTNLTNADGTLRYPEFLFLQRPDGGLITEPDDVETFIGHVMTKTGPQSNLTLVQVVKRATINFKVRVLRDEINHEYWPFLWVHAQENGLGAMRSQSYGRFDMMQFEPTGDTKYAKAHKAWDVDHASEDEIAAFELARAEAIAAGDVTPEPTEHLVRI